MQISSAKLTWSRLITVVGLSLLFLKTVISWLFPELVIAQKISAITTMVLFVQLSFEVPSLIKRYRENRREGLKFMEQVTLLVPEKLIALFRLECGQQRVFFSWICRRKFTVKELDGEIFSYHQRSQYSTFLIILLVMCLTDMPVSTLMIGLTVEDALIKTYLHFFLIISTLYTIVWLIADRHAIRSTCHIAGEHSLYLRVGERFEAEIPWAACEHARPILQNKELKDTRKAWLLKQGFFVEETIFCTPFDQPNVALIIKEPNLACIEKYKIKRTKVKNILIFVDEPGEFINSICRYTRN